MKWASDTEFVACQHQGKQGQTTISPAAKDVPKDQLEFALMRLALDSGCPILSLCRGSQMLNVLRGGTLIGDIEKEWPDRIST